MSSTPDDRVRSQQGVALLILELQNDIITPGGKFAGNGAARHAAVQQVVEHATSLADAARRSGAPVIHVHYVVEAGAQGLKLNAPVFQAVQATGALERGSWGAAPVAGLSPEEGDHIVEKTRMNAFYGTNLEALLQGLGIKSLVIAGAWTNMSVEHTARHAADAGFEVTVVSDATSTLGDDWQSAALNYALTNIARIASVDDVRRSFVPAEA